MKCRENRCKNDTEHECALCHINYCTEHLPIGISMEIRTVVLDRMRSRGRSTAERVSARSTVPLPICERCSEDYSNGPVVKIYRHMQRMLETIVEDVRVHRATQALKDDK